MLKANRLLKDWQGLLGGLRKRERSVSQMSRARSLKSCFKRIVFVGIFLLTIVGGPVVYGFDFIPPDLNSLSYTTSNPYYNVSNGQCTWYAWGRANEKMGASVAFTPVESNGITYTYPNAKYWYEHVSNFPSGLAPKPNSIAVWKGASSNPAGHVAYIEGVEDVNGVETIYFTEANVTTYPNGGYDTNNPKSRSSINDFEHRGGGIGDISGYIYLDNGATQNNCAATVSSGFVVHIPTLTYSGYKFWVDLQYNSSDKTLSLMNYGFINDVSPYSNCTTATLSPGLELHIPALLLGNDLYWIDLQYGSSGFVITAGGAITTPNIPTLKWPLDSNPANGSISGFRFGDDWLCASCSSCGGQPKKHTGVDLRANIGDAVYAAEAGTVTIYNAGAGWAQGIVLQHGGFTTTYIHVNPVVTDGQSVVKGQEIATIANINGPHLHFGVRTSTYSEISKRGALPQINTTENTFCQNDPVFPEKFVDPMLLAYDSENTYTITPSAGPGGSISPNTPQTVNSGATTSFTVTPNTGYSISSVSGCGGTLFGNTYTTGPITANCTVTATFTTSSVNGICGASNGQTFASAPTANLCTTGAASSVSGSGPWVWTCNGSNGGTNANCSANIQNAYYTVTPSAGAGGSISPNTPQTVNSGATTSFTVTPSTGYSISSVSGCGGTLSGSTYTTGAINSNCTVVASFTQQVTNSKYTDNGNGTVTDKTTGLTWQQGENSQSGTYFNWYQASGTYDATYNPSSQNVCGSLSLAGVSWRLPTKDELLGLVDTSYTPPHPTIDTNFFPHAYESGYWSSTTDANYTNYAWSVGFYYGVVGSTNESGSRYVRCVHGAVTQNTYTVTPSAGTGGSISPSTPQTVVQGATATFTVTPYAGYTSSVMSTCGGGTLVGTTYTTSAITANCTVVAGFTPIGPTGKNKFTDNGNGTVTDSITGLTWQQGENALPLPNWYQASGTYDVVNNTTAQNFCGSLSLAGGGWRLPTRTELESLIDSSFNPTINTNYFPKAYASSYWSSTLDASDWKRAWMVDFSYGYAYSGFKVSGSYVRCVRGGVTQTYTVTPSAGTGGSISPSTPQTVVQGASATFIVTPTTGYVVASVGGTCGGNLSGSTYTTNPINADCTVVASFTIMSISKYTDNGNGTVTDNYTGLTWQQGENSTSGDFNWYQATGTYDATRNPSSQNVCGSLSLAGGGWRLPSLTELQSLVDKSFTPTINTNYFPKAYANSYWSSTTYANYTLYAWLVYFGGGGVSADDKAIVYYVRCVR